MRCETTVSDNCGGTRPQTAHTETHRLQSTIHLSHHPYLCFLSPLSSTYWGHRLPNPSIHLLAPFILHQRPSIHPSPLLHMTSTIPIAPSIFVGRSPSALTAQLEHFPIRHNAIISAGSKTLLKPIIQPDTSCPYLPPSSRAKPPTHAYFPLMLVQLLPSPPVSKPQTTGL